MSSPMSVNHLFDQEVANIKNHTQKMIDDGKKLIASVRENGLHKKQLHHLPDWLVERLVKLDLGTLALPCSGQFLLDSIDKKLVRREANMRLFSRVCQNLVRYIHENNSLQASSAYTRAHEVYQQLPQADQASFFSLLEWCYLALHPHIPSYSSVMEQSHSSALLNTNVNTPAALSHFAAPSISHGTLSAHHLMSTGPSDTHVIPHALGSQSQAPDASSSQRDRAIERTKEFIAHEESIRELERMKTDRILHDYQQRIHAAALRLAELEDSHNAILLHHKKMKNSRNAQEKLHALTNELEQKKHQLEGDLSQLHILIAKAKRELSFLHEKRDRLLHTLDQKEMELTHVSSRIVQMENSRSIPSIAFTGERSFAQPHVFAQQALELTTALQRGDVNRANETYQSLRSLYASLSSEHKQIVYPAILRLQQEFLTVKGRLNLPA